MKKMPRIRQIAKEVNSGLITFQKGYNKVLNCVKSVADAYEREAYIHNFNQLCA